MGDFILAMCVLASLIAMLFGLGPASRLIRRLWTRWRGPMI